MRATTEAAIVLLEAGRTPTLPNTSTDARAVLYEDMLVAYTLAELAGAPVPWTDAA